MLQVVCIRCYRIRSTTFDVLLMFTLLANYMFFEISIEYRNVHLVGQEENTLFDILATNDDKTCVNI